MPIEEVAEDISLSQTQTPLKERSISYSDSEGFPELSKSFDKFVEMKTPETLHHDFHHDFRKNQDSSKSKTLELHHSYSIEVPGLPVVTEELNNSKESLELFNNSKDSGEPFTNNQPSFETPLRQSIEISIKEPDKQSSNSASAS